MGGDKDLKITAGLDGTDAILTDVGKIKSAWASAGEGIANSVKGAATSITQSLASVGQDALRTVTVMNTISLGEAVQSARKLQDDMARLSIVAGGSVDTLNEKFTRLSKQDLIGEDRLVGMARSLGRVTYDATGSIQAIHGLNEEAVATGRSAEEMLQLGEVLHNSLGVIGDTSDALGKIRAQAEALGTTGGPAALQNQIVSLGNAMSQLATDTEGRRNRLTAFFGVVGQGMSPQAAARAQAGAIGALEGNALDISRTLGYDVLDEQGHIKDPAKVVQDLKASMNRRGMGARSQLLAFRRFAGAEAGSRLFYGDFSDDNINGLANLPPSNRASSQAALFAQSKAGQRLATQLTSERDARAAAEPLLDAQDAWNQFFAGSPVAKLLAGSLLNATASSILGKASKGVSALFGGGGAASAAGGEAAIAGGGVAGGGTTAAGALAADMGALNAQAIVAHGSLTGLGTSIGGLAAPVAVVVGGIAAQVKTLTELGEASRAKQGFDIKAISKDEAEQKAETAKRAADEGKRIREQDAAAARLGEIRDENEKVLRRRSDVQKIAAVMRATGGEGALDVIRGQDPELYKRVKDDSYLQQAIQMMRDQKVQVTIVNASGHPIAQVDDERARGAGAQ